MPADNEQSEGVLLSIWQAITLVGEVRERSDEIEPSELEAVLEEAESLLIGAVSEAAQCPDGLRRRRGVLRFWKAAHPTPPDHVSWSGSTSVIPFPANMLSKASPHGRFHESTAPRTSVIPGISQPPQLPGVDPGGAEATSKILRLLLLIVMAVLPMIAIQAWHEHDLRNERAEVIQNRVVHRAQQLATDVAELREGARQLLLAIAQLEVVKLRQPEACSTLLANLRSHYPNYGLLGAADAEGRIFCASGLTAASVADQPFFTRAMAHDGLAIGNYWVDPTNGQKMIHLATQFYDGSGHVAGVVFAGLDLNWLSDHLRESGLPPESSKLIADREGNIIARLPNPEEFVGQNMRRSHERIMDGGEAGWEEVTGVDGVTRIFGYVPSSLPPRDFFLSIGESKAESFAAINSATWRDAARILAGLLASIWVAWAGRRLVCRPTKGCAAPPRNLTRVMRGLATQYLLTRTA